MKGGLLALVSAACLSVTFVASKQAMRDLAPLAFMPIWFVSASGWGAGFYLWRRGFSLPGNLRPYIRPVLLIGFLNGLANYLFFTSVKLGDPTLVAFFSRSETVYAVLLGAWLLGERMNRRQWLGTAITVMGAGAITFRAGSVVWLMLLLTLISNFFLALSTLVAKKNVAAVPPLVLSITRTLIMGVMIGLAGLVTGRLVWPGQTAWLWIIGGAFFGPFLSYFLFYKALVYLDLAKGAVFRATQPFFVAVYSFILFSSIITLQQFVGGLAMIAGVVLILWQRKPDKEGRSL